MVQLKAFTTTALISSTHISIPYGSIKRNRLPHQPVPVLISIPYGSIKRVIVPISLDVWTLFQFLMVQLKEVNETKSKIEEFNFNSLWFN